MVAACWAWTATLHITDNKMISRVHATQTRRGDDDDDNMYVDMSTTRAKFDEMRRCCITAASLGGKTNQREFTADAATATRAV